MTDEEYTFLDEDGKGELQYYFARLLFIDLHNKTKRIEIFKLYIPRDFLGRNNLAEYVVYRYFKKKGFTCFKNGKRIFKGERVGKSILFTSLDEDISAFKEKLSMMGVLNEIELFTRSGAPDFFVANDNDAFCVEVKTDGDTLRKKQVEWMQATPTNLKIKICFVNARTNPLNSWFKEFNEWSGKA